MNHYTKDEARCLAFLAIGAASDPDALFSAGCYHFDGRVGLISEALPAAARSAEHAYRMLEPELLPFAKLLWFRDVLEPLGAWLVTEWAKGATPGRDEIVEWIFVRANELEQAA